AGRHDGQDGLGGADGLFDARLPVLGGADAFQVEPDGTGAALFQVGLEAPGEVESVGSGVANEDARPSSGGRRHGGRSFRQGLSRWGRNVCPHNYRTAGRVSTGYRAVVAGSPSVVAGSGDRATTRGSLSGSARGEQPLERADEVVVFGPVEDGEDHAGKRPMK